MSIDQFMQRNFQKNNKDNEVQKRATSMYENRWRLFFERHVYAALTSLGRMSRAPLATLMTVGVIGLSLALPMGLFLVHHTAQKVSAGWDQSAQISLYLNQYMTEQDIDGLMQRLKLNPKIAGLGYVSAEQGLADFQQYSGFGELLNDLPNNPLPAVIEVKPVMVSENTETLESLLEELKQYPEVELAQLDMQWIKRLYAIIDVSKRAMMAIGFLLAIGVALIVSNTINLAMEKYHEELEVISLVGGTKGFMRRPFLYIGAFYGIFGGILAWLCVDLTLLWLQGPVTKLASLYNSQFHFEQLGFKAIISVVLIGALLGWLGSYFAVEKQLKNVMTEK